MNTSSDGRAPFKVLTEEGAPLESFHDCHMRGMSWNGDEHSFVIALDYIVEWIAPDTSTPNYRFRISRAEIVFESANEVEMSLAWSPSQLLVCQIDSVHIEETRTTPNGTVEKKYVFAPSTTDGVLSLWSTGYEVTLLSEPVVCTTTRLSGRGA
jgi:hypothetical protein